MSELKDWVKSERYFQKGLGLKQEVQESLGGDYHSRIVEDIRSQGFEMTRGNASVFLAREFGFCYGVDRAVDYAYETCQKFPDKKIFLANEIIHNPYVNKRLEDLGVKLLAPNDDPNKKLGGVCKEDVVLISAFGSPVAEMKKLREIGCIVVDTTCGSVMSVWKSVEGYARDGYTSIVHGKYDHEETKATCSRVTQYPGAHYLVVRDKGEAEFVCQYIKEGGSSEGFLRKFSKATSPNFKPEEHLKKFGLANQTTMLSQESMEIGEMIRKALESRYGSADTKEMYRSFDTICSATQDRQDAVRELLQKKLDFMIVVGGYNSSNTNHLAEISQEVVPAYHISDAACLVSKDQIRYKKVGAAKESEGSDWFPSGNISVGITAGASTPNRKVGEVIERVFQLSGGANG